MTHNMFESKMKNFPVITTGALGEMVLYHDTIILNKVAEDTIETTIAKLKEAFPFVKHFIYVDGIFFRRYTNKEDFSGINTLINENS